MNTELKELRLDEIRPSKTNPRKDFDSPAAKNFLEEMAATVRVQGVKQPALVRPDYCLGTQTMAEIAAKRRDPVFWVLIAGECRMRASALADKETLPCLVEEVTDDGAREIQQIENLQRRDLSPLEEAASFAEMLELKDDTGAPRYTVDALAQKAGRSADWIYKRISLMQLPPAAREALELGNLPPKTAGLIAAIPNAGLREAFAQAVLKPQYGEGPLTFRAAKEMKEEKYVRTLKGAPFVIDEAALLPSAGSCTVCPKLSANCAYLFDAEEKKAHLKQRICLDPICYQRKIEALHVRHADEAANAGKKLLPAKDSERIFSNYDDPGEQSWDSPYVEIARQPEADLLKKEVKEVPSWKSLIEEAEEKTGAAVPRILAHDQAGVLRELVEKKLAVALIEKAGEPIFKDPKDRGEPRQGSQDFDRQRKAEMERSKLQLAVTLRVLQELHLSLISQWRTSAVWEALWDTASKHAGCDGLWLIGKWKNLKFGPAGSDKTKVVWKWAEKLPAADRQALVPILLVAQGLKWSGMKLEEFGPIADLAELNLKRIADDVAECLKIEKGAKAQKKKAADEKKAAPKATSKAAPGKVRAKITDEIRTLVRDCVAAGKTGAEIAKLAGISLPSVQNIKKALGYVKDRAQKRALNAGKGGAAK